MSNFLPALDAATWKRLQDTAFKAAAKAYAPYSKFRVGAALLFDDGFIASGCNVENVSYGLTNCAERSALFGAISERGANHKVVAIAVTNLDDASSPPCGACRQVLSEFVAGNAMVSFPGEDGIEVRPFAELFPFSFHLDSK
jgi:cytidine deaminase